MNLYIDARNRDLWFKLNTKYEISIKDSVDDIYECFTQGKSATIYIPKSTLAIESFTHELLHVYMGYKDIHIVGRLKSLFASDYRFNGIYDENLLNHIGNCLEHVKMLPIYLEMNFQREKFIMDYFERKGTKKEVENLVSLLDLGSDAWKLGIHLLLAKYFSMKACPNTQFNYSDCFEVLKSKDEVFFNILNSFWNSWITFDIDSFQPVLNDYANFCFDFVDKLGSWVESRYPV